MKKIIFSIVLLITTTMCMFSKSKENYRHLDWNRPELSITAYGGYNFLEKAPLAGGTVAVDVNFIRAELDYGWSYVMAPKRRDFTYFSPSIGFVLGRKSQVYLMGGFTGWPYVIKKGYSECQYDVFNAKLFHFHVQLGTNIALGKGVFASVRAVYVIPKNRQESCINYQNLALRAGIGYWF